MHLVPLGMQQEIQEEVHLRQVPLDANEGEGGVVSPKVLGDVQRQCVNAIELGHPALQGQAQLSTVLEVKGGAPGSAEAGKRQLGLIPNNKQCHATLHSSSAVYKVVLNSSSNAGLPPGLQVQLSRLFSGLKGPQQATLKTQVGAPCHHCNLVPLDSLGDLHCCPAISKATW